jgi:predicted phosphodiesterase
VRGLDLLVHDLDHLELDPKAASITAVINGHSHRPTQHLREGVLYFNPGSAGPRRFHLPVSAGRLHIRGQQVEAEIIMLLI